MKRISAHSFSLPICKYMLAAFFMAAMCCQETKAQDTLSIYRKIKKTAYKRKITRFLYHTIFVDPAPEKYEEKPLSDNQHKTSEGAKYEGKIIRELKIEVLDPFGYSVNDTLRRETNGLQKAANRYHMTTRNWLIEDLLLFGRNDTIDDLKVTESERILRRAPYVNDARIYIQPVKGSRDSVDVKVVVHDKWTVVVPLVFTSTAARILVRDRNLLGLGQQFEHYMNYSAVTGNVDYGGRYYVANISKTYISSNLFYAVNDVQTQAGISFDRPFYSPLAKWAGGLAVTKTWTNYDYTDTIGEQQHPLDFYSYDVWGAKSFSPGKAKTEKERGTSIILALRHARTYYSRRPPIGIDTLWIYRNAQLYLGSVGFSFQKFYKDQYIYRFGANEDIPEGLAVQWLYGVEEREQLPLRYYTGFEISKGEHFDDFGYFSASMAYGTFFNTGVLNNSTWNGRLFYFSNLIPNGEWYFRQFIEYRMTYGINKDPGDRINFRPEDLYGFNSGTLGGTAKMLLNFETVAYTPYNVIGFRFAPVLLMGFGVLKTDQTQLFKGLVYQAYALGVLIRNENLLNSSFQISVGAYPNQPDGAGQTVRFNPLSTFTLRVGGFAISKPGTVAFQ